MDHLTSWRCMVRWWNICHPFSRQINPVPKCNSIFQAILFVGLQHFYFILDGCDLMEEIHTVCDIWNWKVSFHSGSDVRVWCWVFKLVALKKRKSVYLRASSTALFMAISCLWFWRRKTSQKHVADKEHTHIGESPPGHPTSCNSGCFWALLLSSQWPQKAFFWSQVFQRIQIAAPVHPHQYAAERHQQQPPSLAGWCSIKSKCIFR